MTAFLWLLLALPRPGVCGELWNVHFQATTVPQLGTALRSPYQGPFSYKDAEQLRTSFTSTLFLGARPWTGGELYFDPEAAGGRGLSGVNGIAGAPNGELPRVADPEVTPYVARAFLRQTVALGPELEPVASDQNQLGGRRPKHRLVFTAGKVSVLDIFDNNAYAHDPRGQFLNWTLMANGAWDYPADTRGYTWGAAVEWYTPGWAARLGSFMMPSVANGPDLDSQVGSAHGSVVEGERDFDWGGRTGAVRALAYLNNARMGVYEAATANPPPDVTSARSAGRAKYGFGLGAELKWSEDLGFFSRLGWNDGSTESFAFAPIDRTASIGASLAGRPWGRAKDTLAVAGVVNGISADHRDYLAAGGNDFDIGDGALSYGPEWIVEAYYLADLPWGLQATFDYQGFQDPAYNRARGPLSVFSVRLHCQL